MIKSSPPDKWVLTISAFLHVGAAVNYEDAQTQIFSYTQELKMWAGIIPSKYASYIQKVTVIVFYMSIYNYVAVITRIGGENQAHSSIKSKAFTQAV